MDDEARLTRKAVQAIEAADCIYVSPVTLFEVCQKVRIGTWPEMERHVGQLQDLLARMDIVLAAFNAGIAIRAGLLDWPHRDPFDRMLAATALEYGMDRISADPAFDAGLGVRRVW